MSVDLRTRLMQKRSVRASAERDKGRHPLALIKEIAAIAGATTRLTYLRLPGALLKSAASDPAFDDAADPVRAMEVIGSALLAYMNDLGPIYGKAGQILLSRLDPDRQKLAEALQMDRLYGKWPALDIVEITGIMDRSSPDWRKFLKRIDPVPLGVASIGQAHAAVDHEGREWVVKVIKPDARQRLKSTVDAMEQALSLAEPLAVTRSATKAIQEMRDLCAAFRGEISLRRELDTIQRVRAAMNDGRKQQLLRVPQVYEECCSDDVLVVERFRGVMLSDVVSGHARINPERRQLLARKVLQDLLVQVFELGLFHADPHAGNLILLDDGTVGIFDWGLSGELLPSDRKHIASILKALVAVDFDGLVDALEGIAADAGRAVDRKLIEKELRGFARSLRSRKKPGDGQKSRSKAANKAAAPSLQKMLDDCLKAAERLGIPVPSGLLMMAKTLVTVEGLARGIDPEIKLARAASPVLLRVARPGIKELWKLASRLPALIREYSKLLAWVALPAALMFGALPGDRAQAVTAVIGDSLSTGGGAHPAITYDPQAIWQAMNGTNSVAPRSTDIPGASFWGVTEPSPVTPVILPPGPAEYRGAPSNVARAFIQGGGAAFLNTASYSFAYLLARRLGESPDRILVAAENGARMEDAGAQVWRVIKHMETSGIKRLDRVIILFGGNDICAPSFEDMTSPVDFKSAAFRAFRLLSEHVAKSDHYADGKPLEVFVMQPLPMAQLLTSTSILDKKLRAYGEETTCRELQKKMFLPAKPLDYGDSPEAIQIKRISWFLPPNPAMICATLFGWNAGGGEKADDHLARISNRLRALREALADAVAKADGKVSREAIVDRIKFTLIDASGAIQLDGSDIAGDCFHLSAHGHESLARTILKEISGR